MCLILRRYLLAIILSIPVALPATAKMASRSPAAFDGNWSVELSLTMDLVIGPIATASILRVENCVMRGPPALPHPGKSAETV